jgi:hypothetical protein
MGKKTSPRPIEFGWKIVLKNAPNRAERRKADESFKTIFYGGASWMWQMVKDKINDDFLTAKIEEDFKQWRETERRTQH